MTIIWHIFSLGMDASWATYTTLASNRMENVWWDNSKIGCWIRKLLSKFKELSTKKNGDIECYMAYCSTGHGCFMGYLHNIGKQENGGCLYRAGTDSAKHIVILCPKYHIKRRDLEKNWARSYCITT